MPKLLAPPNGQSMLYKTTINWDQNHVSFGGDTHRSKTQEIDGKRSMMIDEKHHNKQQSFEQNRGQGANQSGDYHYHP
jgi:hypothetical protein